MRFISATSSIASAIIPVSLLIHAADAFVTPKPFSVARTPCLPANALPPKLTELVSTIAIADGTQALPEMEPAPLTPSELNDASAFMDQAGDTLRNLAVGIVGVIAVVVGISFLFASFIIPKAAEQLEAQVKEKDPDLWREFEAKLEPGEVMAMRPDLMQELGNKLQQANLEEFERMQNEAQQKTETTTESVVDVEVITEKEDDE